MSRTSWKMLTSPPTRVHLENGRLLPSSEVPDHPDTNAAMQECDICRPLLPELERLAQADDFTSTVAGAEAFERARHRP